jgi:adenylate cyclase
MSLNTDIAAEELLKHLLSLPIINSTLTRLEHQLPNNLYYHNLAHTKDVLKEVVIFGCHDSLNYNDIYLLSLAAAFHDIGFISKSKNNETLCAEMANEGLRSEPNLSLEERELILQMILDTALAPTPIGPKQIANTRLSGYLLDADVSNLGRTDFFDKVELVRLENRIDDFYAFYRSTLTLVDAHEWYTPAAKELRSEQKIKNREELAKKIIK